MTTPAASARRKTDAIHVIFCSFLLQFVIICPVPSIFCLTRQNSPCYIECMWVTPKKTRRNLLCTTLSKKLLRLSSRRLKTILQDLRKSLAHSSSKHFFICKKPASEPKFGSWFFPCGGWKGPAAKLQTVRNTLKLRQNQFGSAATQFIGFLRRHPGRGSL